MRIKNIAVCAAAAIAVLLGACLGAPRSAFAASSGEQVMYRLYNSYTGEHLYTGSVEERDRSRSSAGPTRASAGWFPFLATRLLIVWFAKHKKPRSSSSIDERGF